MYHIICCELFTLERKLTQLTIQFPMVDIDSHFSKGLFAFRINQHTLKFKCILSKIENVNH